MRPRDLAPFFVLASCATPLPPEPAPPPRPAAVEPPTVIAPPPPPPLPAAEPAPPPPPPPPETITVRGTLVRVQPRPKRETRFIGMLRGGASIALRSPDLVRGEGCSGGFYAIEPRGYVCNDHTVTRSPSPRFVAEAEAAAGSPGPLPYRYAFSDGAPMYNRVPTAAEQQRTERGFGPSGDKRTTPKRASTYQDLATLAAIAASDAMPSFLADGGAAAEDRWGLVRETLPAGSMMSFTKAFEAEGRTWLLSADQTLVPADRVRRFNASTFRGVRLAGEVKLPLAWMRGTPRPRYRKLASGAFEKTGSAWPVRSFVPIAGLAVEHEGKRWLPTSERDTDGEPLFASERDVTLAEAATALPTGVKPDQKWIVVSITQGTLVAYEGLTPVYATLMSPGRGGVPIPGHDNVEDSTTPTGTYNVTFKSRASTMSPDKPGEPRTHWIADVPHTQYFKPPFALHAAYWHDRFGEPTSAGCINVSPLDAEALFVWSDPQVPDAWQGATGAGAPENGKTTAIVVRR